MARNDGYKMITEIAEPIIVSALFKAGRITPRVFSWRGRRYKVEKILGHYHYFKGVWRQDCWSLSCGPPDIFEVAFDTEDMSWRLDRLHTEG